MEKPDNCTDEMYVLPSFVCHKEALATSSAAAKTSLFKELRVFFKLCRNYSSLKNWKIGISRGSRTVTAKKCTRKCAARAELLFDVFVPIAVVVVSKAPYLILRYIIVYFKLQFKFL